jgi:hypothetical protein
LVRQQDGKRHRQAPSGALRRPLACKGCTISTAEEGEEGVEVVEVEKQQQVEQERGGARSEERVARHEGVRAPTRHTRTNSCPWQPSLILRKCV